MCVDDHAIDALRPWFDLSYDELKKEYCSGEYRNLTACPSYPEAFAYWSAMNVLNKTRYGSGMAPLKRQLDEEMEIIRFRELQKTCPHKKTRIIEGDGVRIVLCSKCFETLKREEVPGQ